MSIYLWNIQTARHPNDVMDDKIENWTLFNEFVQVLSWNWADAPTTPSISWSIYSDSVRKKLIIIFCCGKKDSRGRWQRNYKVISKFCISIYLQTNNVIIIFILCNCGKTYEYKRMLSEEFPSADCTILLFSNFKYLSL